MAKRITIDFLMLMAAFSVVMGSVIPHHHHHGESIICVADDLHAIEDHCNHGHSSGDDSCCQLKYNLLTHFGDSRKENAHCDCGTAHDFHAGHLYILLNIPDPAASFAADEKIPSLLLHRPYANLYHSVLTEGHIGLRAPPVA